MLEKKAKNKNKNATKYQQNEPTISQSPRIHIQKDFGTNYEKYNEKQQILL